MNDNTTGDDEERPVPIPAATLVIFRHRLAGPPELLVVERSASMAFAGGAIVFPGGRIDADDHAIAAAHAHERDEGAARVAAIRETLEESGIAIGFANAPSADWIASAQPRLHAHEPFSSLLSEAGLELDLDTLVPFARWCPAHREARVFDTRFYIASVSDDAPDPVVDATENISSFWASAQEVIDAADAGKVKVIFPTRRNLERLALFDSFAAAEAHARSTPVDVVTPWMEERGGEPHLCIPEGLGYPITSEAMRSAVTAFGKPR
ncbi:NUDIX hydrolase [Aquisediminimonas profunda]|uniref:NUDIX hydrolase n=1 Tax=Aquisediminimonas profunda TaxID=1550733 RepID=UPI001C6355B3|nr:NUDIX domain-containing protein [Aquisediminimonas profunda]